MQRFFAATMRKPWLCLFSIGLLFALVACGGTTSTTSTSTATSAPTPTPTSAPTPTPTASSVVLATTVPTSGGKSISVENFAYNPQTLTIKVGTTVTWTNNDTDVHTVTDKNGAFAAPLPVSGKVSFTFTKAGTYDYYCTYHPEMTGTIIVQ